jgi:hypothetical protein
MAASLLTPNALRCSTLSPASRKAGKKVPFLNFDYITALDAVIIKQ